jgi:hypothetical protein
LLTIGILVAVLSTLFTIPAFAQDDSSQPPSTSLGFISKGDTYYAVEKALTYNKAVRKDLMERGLFTLPSKDSKGNMVPGIIDVGKIESLVKNGTYVIANNSMFLASQPVEENYARSTGSYKYAQMVTRHLEVFDDFNYRGHESYVNLPSSLTLNADTVHCVYTHHLLLPNNQFVESGVGWVSWAPSPIIYTFQSYTGVEVYLSIPSASRTIYLDIEINATTLNAWIYVYDPYTTYSISTNQAVTAANHRVDQCQEEYSTGAWTSTPTIRHHDNRVKNTSNTWVNWNNSIDTDWDNNTPLYENHGITSDKKWIDTWCTP